MPKKNDEQIVVLRLPVRIRVSSGENSEILVMDMQDIFDKNLVTIEDREWLDFGCAPGQKRATLTIQRQVTILSRDFPSFVQNHKSNKSFIYLDVDSPIRQFYLCKDCIASLYKHSKSFRSFHCNIGHDICSLGMLNIEDTPRQCLYTQNFLKALVSNEGTMNVNTGEGPAKISVQFLIF